MRTLMFGLATALVMVAQPAASQTASATATPYPVRPVRLVVPFPPGAATDLLGRLMAQKMGESWGQSVVVENRPGAGSLVGAETVAKASPDGYTLFMGHIGTHGANPALYAKLPYDPLRDFAPVSLLVSIPNLLAVHPSVPAGSVKELLDLARAKPGSINVGTPGISTSAHLILALFRSTTGTDMVHVPYKGTAASMQALAAGEVQAAFDTATALLPHARSGKVRLLAITSKERSPSAPEVPPLAEAGVPGFDVSTWFALFATAGTPPPVIERLHGETVRALRSKDVAERLAGLGMTVHASDPAILAAHVNAEIARWSRVVREANIRAE